MNFHKSKQILHIKIVHKVFKTIEKLRKRDCDSSKSTPIQTSIKQIEGIPRIKCRICKKLEFGKNRIIFGNDLEKT